MIETSTSKGHLGNMKKNKLKKHGKEGKNWKRDNYWKAEEEEIGRWWCERINKKEASEKEEKRQQEKKIQVGRKKS